MRNTLRYVFMVIFAGFCSGTPFVVSAETITLRADSWYPYNGDPQSDKPGYMIEIAKLVFEEAGHNIDYQIRPWARALLEAEQGQINGVIGAQVGDAPTFIFPQNPLGRTRLAFYSLSHSQWVFSGVDSLKSVVVGAILDYSYGPTFDAYVSENTGSNKLLQFTSGETALEKSIKRLQFGKVDVVVESPDVFNWTVASMGLGPDVFRQAGVLPEVNDLYIAFSPKHKDSQAYAMLLSAGVEKLRANGKLAEILARYGVSDWQ